VGDRANFVFVDGAGDCIVLYGHWAGTNMLGRLADAVIAARPRWADESYATRIAISQLIGDQWSMETGWGLQVNSIGDNEHKIPVINWQEQTFSLHEPDSHRNLKNKVLGMKNEAIFTQDLTSFCEEHAFNKILT
jgi:hypothetical protein